TGWRIDIKSTAQAVEAGLAEAAAGVEGGAVEDTDGRCCAVTASGVRCRNKARPGSAFCGLHEKEAAK
ncbi:MAG TPA: antitermination protein NusA, partial [Coriobacteriia bacterium]